MADRARVDAVVRPAEERDPRCPAPICAHGPAPGNTAVLEDEIVRGDADSGSRSQSQRRLLRSPCRYSGRIIGNWAAKLLAASEPAGRRGRLQLVLAPSSVSAPADPGREQTKRMSAPATMPQAVPMTSQATLQTTAKRISGMAIIQLFERSARSLVCLGVLGTSTLSFGAVALPQVTQSVNNQQRVVLKGNVRPMPRGARDLGAVNASTPASRMLLLLKRPAEQEAALQQFIAEAHAPGSASYRHWLTPAQLGSQFGPADSDVQAVVAWLQSQGLAVSKISQAKTTIEFSGTAGQIESAFATKIHSFQVNGVTHVSNVVNPQIPTALAPVIAGISPLNDFRPRAMHTPSAVRIATPAPTSANPKAMSIRPASNQPDLTIGGSSGNFYAVAPAISQRSTTLLIPR